jgi:ATP diphosphatase
VADAIDRQDWRDLCDELGDLLLQVVFHAQMAKEAGLFDFSDVTHAISDKMLRRHPHVFCEQHDDSALAGVSRGLPEWKRALKLQERAAKVGFDWPDERPVLDKLLEEVDEVRAEFADGRDPQRLQDEIGDVLFVVVNLARHAGVDFSQALRHANAKFERRFRRMEQLAREDGQPLPQCDLGEQEALWQRVKRVDEAAT